MPDDWTYPKGLFPGVMDAEHEAMVGGIIRRAVEHDDATMRFYLTCSVGELAQRVVLAYADAERRPEKREPIAPKKPSFRDVGGRDCG